MLKGHVKLVVKLKGLDIKTIQQPVHGVMIWAPMTAFLATTTKPEQKLIAVCQVARTNAYCSYWLPRAHPYVCSYCQLADWLPPATHIPEAEADRHVPGGWPVPMPTDSQ